jgi:hypothetical protein
MGEIPFNVVCLSGQLHDPESVYQYPKWLGNAAALTAEFRHCRIHGDRMLATTHMSVHVSHDNVCCMCMLATTHMSVHVSHDNSC